MLEEGGKGGGWVETRQWGGRFTVVAGRFLFLNRYLLCLSHLIRSAAIAYTWVTP